MDEKRSDTEEVVLVTEHDEPIGSMPKMQAHHLAALHRAFSVFLFDAEGRLLMQKRAAGKYHSAGLWTNTCCSHPRPNEKVVDAARRRTMEEMGIDVPLHHRFSFVYKASFANGLHEHEFDHVFFGQWSGPVKPDPLEVQEWKYASLEEIGSDLKAHPERYTAWLKACWSRVLAAVREEGAR